MSRQSGASTDSRRLPCSSLPLPGMPFSTGATRSSVPSQGMCGWFQQIQASHFPSGDGVGKAKKSVPSTSVRMASGLIGRRAVQRHCHDRAADLAVLMPLLHAPDLALVGRQGEVGVAEAGRSQRAGAVAAWHAAGSGVSGRGCSLPSACPARRGRAAGRRSWRTGSRGRRAAVPRLTGRKAARGHRQVGLAAVLVHPGAGVPWRGQQRSLLAARAVHDRCPAALVRLALLPPGIAAEDGREETCDLPAGDLRGRDRRRPFAKGDSGRCDLWCGPCSPAACSSAVYVPLSVIRIWCPTGLPLGAANRTLVQSSRPQVKLCRRTRSMRRRSWPSCPGRAGTAGRLPWRAWSAPASSEASRSAPTGAR